MIYSNLTAQRQTDGRWIVVEEMADGRYLPITEDENRYETMVDVMDAIDLLFDPENPGYDEEGEPV